jgi:hypothetical protein
MSEGMPDILSNKDPKQKPHPGDPMLLAGSAAVFLGLMDLLYDLEHRMFTPLTSGALIELVL